MKLLKLCKDCRWHKQGSASDGQYDLCTNETIARIAEKKQKAENLRLVRGIEPPDYKVYGFCEIERGSGVVDSCGREGRFWEPKDGVGISQADEERYAAAADPS